MTTQPSDVEIAQAHQLQPIAEIAAKAGIPADAVIPYGTTKAKVDITKVDYSKENQGKLVLVTGVSPTPAGEGKSTVLIGLTDALDKLGKKAIVALREPSQGPVMGIKGGAAGGGYAQIVPMEDINLHFTGDFHAITSATNTLAAIIDNHIHQGNALGIDPRRVTWQRCMDVNDRALRNVVTGLGGPAHGVPAETGFTITAASEIMAILCLATNLEDLKKRLGDITIGFTYDQRPVTARDLNAEGALTALMRDALKAGIVNLERHVENLRKFGIKPVVALNLFWSDTEAEREFMRQWAEDFGVALEEANVWSEGGAGATTLAETLLENLQGGAKQLYDPQAGIEASIETIAREIYRADRVEYGAKALKDLKYIQDNGWDKLPVVISKTQYSFSDDASALGAPEGHTLHVRELLPRTGSGFIVVLTGNVMTMPGLPKKPAANNIDVDKQGTISGLF